MKKNRIVIAAACMLPALLFVATGCGMLKPIDEPSSKSGGVFSHRGPSPVYHDFDDVLVPGELKIDRQKSSVFETEAMSMGVLSLNGKVDAEFLTAFFKTNMAKDNWRPVSGFKAPRSLFLFEKGTRWCVITVAGGRYGRGTQVDIWVAPKTGGAASGLLK